MLLRRVIEHVKAQNWTAVALDFVIVVVGVFIGIQVSNWNAERGHRLAEGEILERLHHEILLLRDVRTARYANRKKRFDDLKGAVAVLFDENANAPLTPMQCAAIARSHIYTAPPDTLPVIDDLISTGRMHLIENDAVKRAISEYLGVREQARNATEVINQNIYRLPVRYPHLIRRIASIDQAGEVSDWQETCNLEGMRASAGFGNELLDNFARYSTLVRAGYRDLDEELDRLLSAVDKALPPREDGKGAT